VEKALSAFGMELSETAIDRMNAWDQGHQPGRHGAHDYTAETFGLDSAELSDRFRSYREHFGVPTG
jgi:hypothetical protein